MTNALDVAVIVPIFNEQDLLWDMIDELSGHFDRIVGEARWRFVLIEDGSTDRTPEIINKIAKKWPLTLTPTMERSDYGAALRLGLQVSGTPYCHIINIEQWDIPFFEWAWHHRKKYDLFLGSKLADPTLNTQSTYRRVLS